MNATKITLLAAIAAMMFWNILASNQQIVRAADAHEYKVISVNEDDLQKTLNQYGHDKWSLRYMSERVPNVQRVLVLER